MIFAPLAIFAVVVVATTTCLSYALMRSSKARGVADAAALALPEPWATATAKANAPDATVIVEGARVCVTLPALIPATVTRCAVAALDEHGRATRLVE